MLGILFSEMREKSLIGVPCDTQQYVSLRTIYDK